MKIALLGYGKMGKVIEDIAAKRGHEIVLRKGSQDSFEGLEQADIAIEFSVPDGAVNNISYALKQGIPVVAGTTGWLHDYDKMVQLCEENHTGFIYGSNFSLGVNIFFELNKYLAKLMSKFPSYQCELEEIHHTQKLDAPSGTAISLANGIVNIHPTYKRWNMDKLSESDLKIVAKRENQVPGTHSIFYQSEVDTIEIKHTAHNREGFALGAVMAAEWLIGKKGVYTMQDVFFGEE